MWKLTRRGVAVSVRGGAELRREKAKERRKLAKKDVKCQNEARKLLKTKGRGGKTKPKPTLTEVTIRRADDGVISTAVVA
jgi:hypothetical protein